MHSSLEMGISRFPLAVSYNIYFFSLYKCVLYLTGRNRAWQSRIQPSILRAFLKSSSKHLSLTHILEMGMYFMNNLIQFSLSFVSIFRKS